MTRSIPTTPRRMNEGPTSARTAVSIAFTGMLTALDTCVAADRLLHRADAAFFASDFDQCLDMAETAREDLMVRLEELIGMAEARPADRPLRQLAFFLHTLLSVEDNADRAYIHSRVFQNARLFLVPRKHPMARAIGHLQRHFFKGCVRLMATQDFGGRGLGDGGACEPALAA